jgi:hypothetical protein
MSASTKLGPLHNSYDGSRSQSAVTSSSFSKPSTRRVRFRSIPMSLLVACLLTASAGIFAVRLSVSYYSIASYHYDSAAYRLSAYQTYQLLKAQGIQRTLAVALKSKDSLDVLLRLLILPRSLLHPYGHLVVLLPFMGLFVFLVVHYIYIRTRSRTCSIAVPAFLFAFPIVYDPLMFGIADYWKDNLAAWLIAAAVISFLLSRNLERLSFSWLSGALLGLLVMQRTVLAVYAVPLFFPPLVFAMVRLIGSLGPRAAGLRLGAFVACPIALSGLVLLCQAGELYTYYFVAGYGYSSMLDIARILFTVASTQLGSTPVVLLPMCLLLFLRILRSPDRDGDAFIGAWMAVGFPLATIASCARYAGFYVVWTVLLIVLLATLFSAFLRSIRTRGPYVIALLLLANACSLLQCAASIAKADAAAQRNAPRRRFHDALAETVLGLPKPRRVALLYDEDGGPFLNHVLFNRRVPLDASEGLEVVGFMSIHDSYYRAVFGDVSIQKISDIVQTSLEAHPGTIAAGICDPASLQTAHIFSADGERVARHVSMEINKYLLADSHWAVLRRIDSPYGCIFIYQYRRQEMTDTEKWRQLVFAKSLDELPVTLFVSPGVRLYNYQSQYKAELFNGHFYQWLPSGTMGLRIMLFSDQSRIVSFEAHAIPGPSRRDPLRTLLIANNEAPEALMEIDSEQDISMRIRLVQGLNAVDFSVREAADQTAGVNTRELMLLLGSPRFSKAREQ